MSKVQFQVAPDVEFYPDVEVEGVSEDSRNWDIQQHKSGVFSEFERRLREAFPEGFRIDSFEFGVHPKD